MSERPADPAVVTPGTWSVDPLPVDDAASLLALCALALPDEVLTVDDLEGAVLAPPDGSDELAAVADPPLVRCAAAATLACRDDDGELVGAVSVSLTDVVGIRSAHLQLLVVHPARRLRGLARTLVGAAESWALAHGSTTLTVGAGAPFYLFTGVDARWTEALSCFEALGYTRVDTELDLVCPTEPGSRSSARSAPARGVDVAHVADDRGALELDHWVRVHHPHWAAEFARAAAAGTVVVAHCEEQLLGAAAHSVSRFGVIGPVAVAPASQGCGVGARLMAAVLQDLSVAGLRNAEIAWTSTVRFYARTCGARVGRASVVLRRELGA